RVEATGKRVRYLNIGDPVAFGFHTPLHLVETVERAMRDGHNGYGPSAGLGPAREAVAAEYTTRGFPVGADRVFLTAGPSEGIELALTAIVDADGEVLVPMPTYPLYTAVLAKIGARARYYRTDPARGWMPDLDELEGLITPATRALVVIDPNNPTGAQYSTATRRALIDLADRHGLALLADEVYADLGFDGPVAPIGSLQPDAPIVSFSSLSKAYLAPGWRTGWMAVGSSPRLDAVVAAVKKLADGRLCSTVPMQYAIVAALTGDRTHQSTFRAALRERAFNRRMLKTVLTATAVFIVVAALWAAREALMLIYVSAIIAMGFSPLVRLIERPRKGGGEGRVPRVLAILAIYLSIIGVLILVVLIVVP